MKWYRADLHIHTVLSPCGDLYMTPETIIQKAVEHGLDIIAITDHNSTLQCKEVIEVGREKGIFVIGGAEVNTREEVHCVTLFPDLNRLNQFQEYLDKWLPNIPNDPETFGHQVVVNRNEEILYTEPRLLWSAIEQDVDEVSAKVLELCGFFFPAHIDRPFYGLLRQLGMIPQDLQADALEVLDFNESLMTQLLPFGTGFTLIANSDSHVPEHIGRRFTWLKMKNISFEEIKMALRRENGRDAKPEII